MQKELIIFTVEELLETLKENGYGISPATQVSTVTETAGKFTDSGRYGVGLRAIEHRYQVSHATAQKMKDGILAPAIYQAGRKIWVDYQKADELLNNAKEKGIASSASYKGNEVNAMVEEDR